MWQGTSQKRFMDNPIDMLADSVNSISDKSMYIVIVLMQNLVNTLLTLLIAATHLLKSLGPEID